MKKKTFVLFVAGLFLLSGIAFAGDSDVQQAQPSSDKSVQASTSGTPVTPNDPSESAEGYSEKTNDPSIPALEKTDTKLPSQVSNTVSHGTASEAPASK